MLIVPPSNDAEFEPNRSFLPTSTSRVEREVFSAVCVPRRTPDGDDGIRRSPERCIKGSLSNSPVSRRSTIGLARLLERAGAWDEAYGHFIAARDLDALPHSLPRTIPGRLPFGRRAARLYPGRRAGRVPAIGRHGLLDSRLFHDAMHPTLRDISRGRPY